MNQEKDKLHLNHLKCIIAFEPSRRQALLKFVKNIFPGQAELWNERWWTWKYIDNPANKSGRESFFVYVVNDKIIACIGLSYAKLKMGHNKEIPAAWHINLAVDSAYRERGIATALVDKANNYAEFCLALGGAEATFRIFDKLGWHYIGKVPTFEFILSPAAKLQNKAIALLKRISLYIFWKIRHFVSTIATIEKNSGILFTQIKSFDHTFDDLWRRLEKQYLVAVRRDKDYLNWRFIQKPGEPYDIFVIKNKNIIVGYLVLRIIGDKGIRKGLIVDFLLPSNDTVLFSGIIEYAVGWFKERKVDIVSCVISTPAFGKILMKKMFIRKVYPGDKLATNISIGEDFINDISNWYITYADSDQDFN